MYNVTMKKIVVIVLATDGYDFWGGIASTLARSGFELIITSPGLGLELMDKISPDVAIVRDNPPQLDGYQFCQEIRHLFDLPLVLLGKKPEKETYTQALEAGVDFYMTWPLHHLELAARVRALLRRQYYTLKEKNKVLAQQIKHFKRRYWRADYKLSISYSLIKPKLHISGKSKTINISRGGVMFSVDQLISAHSLLDLELSLQPELIVRALGEVKWEKKIDGIYHIGVEFIEITEEDKHKIADCIYKS